MSSAIPFFSLIAFLVGAFILLYALYLLAQTRLQKRGKTSAATYLYFASGLLGFAALGLSFGLGEGSADKTTKLPSGFEASNTKVLEPTLLSATTTVQALGQAAVRPCERALRLRLAHPSTYSRDELPRIEVLKSGATRVTLLFEARNSYNLTLRFGAVCVATSSGDAEIFALKEL